MSSLQGWSRAGWNHGPWSQPSPVVITGVWGTGAVSTPVIESSYSVTGVSATSGLGSETVSLITPVSVSGTTMTSGVGSTQAGGLAVVDVSGVSGTGSIESVAGTGNIVVSISNDGLTSGLGRINVWDDITPSQTPNWIEIAA